MAHEPTALGMLIRAQREALGFSQHKLARLAGTPNTQIMRIESGFIVQPRSKLLQTLAAVLGIPAADLFAAAGYGIPSELPSFRPYLRAKYQNLPPEALAELHRTFAALAEKYGTEGPAPGEDE